MHPVCLCHLTKGGRGRIRGVNSLTEAKQAAQQAGKQSPKIAFKSIETSHMFSVPQMPSGR